MKGEEYLRVRPFLKHSIINMESKAKVPDEYSIYNYVRKVRLKNGNYTDSVLNWYNTPDIVDGPFSRITIEEPSISKRQKIIDQLLSYGWKPKLFTDKGLPKLTEKGQPVDTLEEVGDFGKALASWYTLNHRQSQIRGFLPHVRSNSRIAAQCNPCGTNTFRAKHKVVANIPRPTSTFGKEMRSLFGVGEGRVFVGADLSGLELRVLAHHMKNEEYIHQILDGDIHLYNLHLTGTYISPEQVNPPFTKADKERLAAYRDIAKTFIW